MMTHDPIFVGIDIFYGRRPFTFAVLGDDLNVISMTAGDLNDLDEIMSAPEMITVCISVHPKSKNISSANAKSKLDKQLGKNGFQSYPAKNHARQRIETDAEQTFSTLVQKKLLPRRTLEGRLQRALILFKQGLQISDPMEFFEEITRYKLVQGILPLETIHSSKELDALAAAYVAWMMVNRPEQIIVGADKQATIVLLWEEQND